MKESKYLIQLTRGNVFIKNADLSAIKINTATLKFHLTDVVNAQQFTKEDAEFMADLINLNNPPVIRLSDGEIIKISANTIGMKAALKEFTYNPSRQGSK